MRSEDRVATGVDADPTPNPVAPTPLEGRRRLRAAFAAVPRQRGAWRGRRTEEARVPWLGLGLGCAIPNPDPDPDPNPNPNPNQEARVTGVASL